MTRILLPILVFAGSLIGALLGVQLVRPTEPGVIAGPRPVDSGVAEALEDIRRRLDRPAAAPRPEGAPPVDFDALDERLRSLETKIDSLAISASGGAEPALVDLKAKTDEAVVSRARALFSRKEYDLALEYWEEVLRRNPDPKVRDEALYGAGLGYRTVKNHEKEEGAFLELAKLRGEDTEDGLSALFQVGWARYYGEDYSGGKAMMARIARAPNTSMYIRPWARIYEASFAVKAGQPEGVRAILDDLTRDYKDDMSQTGRTVMGQVNMLIRELDNR